MQVFISYLIFSTRARSVNLVLKYKVSVPNDLSRILTQRLLSSIAHAIVGLQTSGLPQYGLPYTIILQHKQVNKWTKLISQRNFYIKCYETIGYVIIVTTKV